MKKLTGSLIGLAFLLCTFTVQAASEINISVPSVGEACSDTEDCSPGESCIDDICSVATPCSNDLDCGPGELCIDDICSVATACSSSDDCPAGDVCVDEICVQGECESNADCDEGLCDTDSLMCVDIECFTTADCEGELLCDTTSDVPTSNMCVECLSITDCPGGDYCSENKMCELGDDCDSKVKPRRIKISKIQKNNEKRSEKNYKPFRMSSLKMAGNENFDPNGVIDVGVFLAGAQEKKKKSVKFAVQVGTDLELGFYPFSVGSCVGEVELD